LPIEGDPEALTLAERLAVTFWFSTAERPAIKVWMPRQNY